MPVYNAANYVEEAAASILQQTFRDFEFIIVDDGSTDGSAELLELIQRRDGRVKVYHQGNSGIVDALNKGCDLACGTYVVRMDSDDISLPERIAWQVSFLEDNPDVGVCGTWIQLFGDIAGDIWKTPIDNDSIHCRLLFDSPFNHPTVAMRRGFMEEFSLRYRHGFDHTEDYDLWERFSHHTQLANLPKVSLLYRTHANQVTKTHNDEKILSAGKIRHRQFIALGIIPTQRQLAVHESICYSTFLPTEEALEEIEEWLCTLTDANTQKLLYNKRMLQQNLGDRWFNICTSATRNGLWTWKKFYSSSLSDFVHLSLSARCKFLIKCLIKKERRG